MYISKEQTFSIPATAFSVGATSNGYTLAYSADGVNFSEYEKDVPANEVLLVGHCPKFVIFKLVGNVDDNVSVRY